MLIPESPLIEVRRQAEVWCKLQTDWGKHRMLVGLTERSRAAELAPVLWESPRWCRQAGPGACTGSQLPVMISGQLSYLGPGFPTASVTPQPAVSIIQAAAVQNWARSA